MSVFMNSHPAVIIMGTCLITCVVCLTGCVVAVCASALVDLIGDITRDIRS